MAKAQPKFDADLYGKITIDLPRIYPIDESVTKVIDGVPALPDNGGGEAALKFLSRFRWAEGRSAGKPIDSTTLAPYQETLIRSLFGYTDPVSGTRIINNIFFSCARKNAKSSTVALLALCFLASTREPKGEILLAAGSSKQASRLFDLVESIAKTDPTFWSSIRSRRFPVFELRHTQTDCVMKVVASEAERIHGLSPHVVLFDEIAFNTGEAGRRLLAALRTGFGARKNPLMVQLSTTPDVPLRDGDIYADAVAFDRKIKSGDADDRRYLGISYFVEQDDDISDENVWRKANPGLGYSLDIAELREEYTRAVVNSGSENEAKSFAALRLNQIPKSALANGLLPERIIKKVEKPISIDDLIGADEICCGVDLGGSEDVSCLTFVARFGSDYVAYCLGWLSNASYQRHRRRVPLDKFVEAGVLTIVESEIVSPNMIAEEILSIAEHIGCSDVSLDPAMANTVISILESNGLKCHLARQGAMSMSSPILTFQSLCESGNFSWPDDGFLSWFCRNSVLLVNSVGMRITKQSETGQDPNKIDGMSALLSAMQFFLMTDAASQQTGEAVETVSPWLEPDRAFNIKRFGRDGADTLMMINGDWSSSYVSARYDELGSKILSSETRPERIAI